MKLLLLLTILFAIVYCAPHVYKGTPEEQFQQFKAQFNKSYKSPTEEKKRLQIFKNNLLIAQQLTQQSKGKTQYGVNQFTDLSPEEFRHQYLMDKSYYSKNRSIPNKHIQVNQNVTVEWPQNSIFDWRFPNPKTGYNGACISPVYNQGQCGSCWAFSATEQTEAMTCLAGYTGGRYIQNSMQQVVSCDTTSDGCSGGWTYSAYQYIMGCGGQDSYASYPYYAENTACAFNPNTIQSRISNWGWVGQGNEGAMLSYVSSTGPLSICVDASTWQYYNGGVITSCPQQVDHCVQITGYGSVDGLNVWVVRNSWGTSWGYGGYLYVEYGQNVCAIADYPSSVAAN